MITKKEQYKLLAEDIRRAEKAGLVTKVRYHDNYYSGECFTVDVEVAGNIVAELLGYLNLTYPDVGFRQTSQHTVWYDI